MRTGGVEPPQHEATGLQPAELTDAQRPQRGVADRARTGASGLTLPDAAATPRPPRSGDDRRRTGDLSPDKRVLSQLSYVPAAPRLDSSARRRKGPLTPSCTGRLVRRRAAGSCSRAGGSSSPRVAADAAASDWRGWDSNPRSRAHEAREDSRSSTAQVWLAGVEPAISGARSRRGGHAPLQPDDHRTRTPGGTRTRTSGLRARRHPRFDHGGMRLPGYVPGHSYERPRQGSNLRTLGFEAPGSSAELRSQGAAGWTRTSGLRLRGPTLSPLSYRHVEALGGFEPPSRGVEIPRSVP